MKLLDIMKKYDRCLVRESTKLTKIYNMLLKESTDDTLDEKTCPECGNDPCTCESDEDKIDFNETEVEPVSSNEGLDEEEKDKECDECDLIPEKDFFETENVEENDMLRNRPHNAHIDDPRGVVAEDEDTETIPAKEFFAEAEKECTNEDADEDADKETPKAKDKTDGVEMMLAEEFFAEAEKECTGDECNETEDEKDDVSEEEMIPVDDWLALNEKEDEKEKTDEVDESEKTEKQENNADENESEEEDKLDEDEEKLQESLKSYRRKNHHLFND